MHTHTHQTLTLALATYFQALNSVHFLLYAKKTKAAQTEGKLMKEDGVTTTVAMVLLVMDPSLESLRFS